MCSCAARADDPVTGHSVLFGRRTTALTWTLESKAWDITRWSRFWDPDYYRTYMEEPGQRAGFMSVQQEVTRALARPDDFGRRPQRDCGLPPQDERPRALTAPTDTRPAWVVR